MRRRERTPTAAQGLAAACLCALALGAGCTKELEARIASQGDELAALRIDKAELEATKGDLEAARSELERRVDECLSGREELEARLASLVEYQRALESQLEELGLAEEKTAKKYRAAAEKYREAQETLAAQQKLIDEMKKQQELARARLDTLRGMLVKFGRLIEGGKLSVRIRDGKLMLELPSAVLFESGRADVSEDGLVTLREVAAVLATIDDRELQVAGHTDDVPITSGKHESNWALSAARALAVVEALVEMGVDPTRLSAAGYSEHHPAVPNDSVENRAQNRRIEIVLMPNLDELPDLSGLESELEE